MRAQLQAAWNSEPLRVRVLFVTLQTLVHGIFFYESRSSGLECKLGGKFHLKLHMNSKPIANKYHEGKMKSTLERELNVPKLAERKADGTSCAS